MKLDIYITFPNTNQIQNVLAEFGLEEKDFRTKRFVAFNENARVILEAFPQNKSKHKLIIDSSEDLRTLLTILIMIRLI